MLGFFQRLYGLRWKSARLERYQCRIMVRLADTLMPIVYRAITTNGAQPRREGGATGQQFIVSLTTFPQRIQRLWLVVESMLRQSERPEKIILWLYSGEFKGRESLPLRLLQQERRGLQIRFCDENLMGHKKYIYSMAEFPDANIVTIDDDFFYPPDLLAKLKKAHADYPEAILCSRAREILIEGQRIQPYKNWKLVQDNTKPSFQCLAIGCGGTLFPSNSIHRDAFDVAAIMRCALRADDLWLKIMSLRKGTKVATLSGDYPRFFLPVLHRDDTRLMDSNIDGGGNDMVFRDLVGNYGIPASAFKG